MPKWRVECRHFWPSYWWETKSPWRTKSPFLPTKATLSCWAPEPCTPGATSDQRRCLSLVCTTVLQGSSLGHRHLFIVGVGQGTKPSDRRHTVSESPFSPPSQNQESWLSYLIKCIVHNSIFLQRLIPEGPWVLVQRSFWKSLSTNLPDMIRYRLVSLRQKLQSYCH